MKWLLRLIASVGILGGLAFAAFIGFVSYMYWTYGETDYSLSPDKEGTRRITLKGQSSIQTMGGPSFTREWVLDVPKAFMGVDSGSNSGSRTIYLQMGLNPQTMELVPNPNTFNGDPKFINFFITLRNQSAPVLIPSYPEISRQESCIDMQERRELIFKTPPPKSIPGLEEIRECNSPNCSYYIRFNGWPVDVLVSKKEYLNKEKYCKFTRELLNNWTVKIEDMRK